MVLLVGFKRWRTPGLNEVDLSSAIAYTGSQASFNVKC